MGTKNWVFYTELTALADKILRVFYFENKKDNNSNNKA